MNETLAVILAIFGTVGSSIGFWQFMANRGLRKNALVCLMMGMAHERIVQTGIAYIERGYITTEEYGAYSKYFFEPYISLGGNGLAQRVYEEVKRLPIRGDRVDTKDIPIVKN